MQRLFVHLATIFARDENGVSGEIEARKLLPHPFLLVRIAAFFFLALLGISAALAQSSHSDSNSLQVIAPASSYPEIDTLVRAKKWQDVVALTESLHGKDPDNPLVLYWLGTSHLELRQPVAAVQAFRAAERLGLNTAALHEDLGLAYYDLNQFILFEQQMKKAAVSNPADSKPDYYLGLYRWTIRSDASGALELFEKAIHLAPDDWKSAYQAGNCLEQMGKLNDARGQYSTAIHLLELSGAHFGWPYQGMARLMIDDNPQRALELAKKAVEMQPEEASNHLLLAEIFERLGNLPDAIREAQTASGENPNDSKTQYSLYKLYREAGDPRAKGELAVFEQTKKLYDSD